MRVALVILLAANLVMSLFNLWLALRSHRRVDELEKTQLTVEFDCSSVLDKSGVLNRFLERRDALLRSRRA